MFNLAFVSFIVSFLLGACLVCIKFYAWLRTDSLSIQTSLIDSLFDASLSLCTLIFVRYAYKPPDANHKFGHAKIEPFVALVQAIFMLGVVTFIMINAFRDVLYPSIHIFDLHSIFWLIIGLLISGIIIVFQTIVLRKTHSLAVKADTLHYKTDFYINLVVLISYAASSFYKLYFVDALCATIISLYITKQSLTIIKECIDILMDRELDSYKTDAIIEMILSNKDIKRVYDVRTRSTGQQLFVQCNIELDGDMSLFKTYFIRNHIAKQIKQSFGADIFISCTPGQHYE